MKKKARSRASARKSSTTAVNVSMPAQLRTKMYRRMEKGGFENVSEYVRSLIREDLAHGGPANLAELDAEIMRGVNSPGKPIGPDYWTRMLERAKGMSGRTRKAG